MPLRSLILQPENDFGDEAEIYKGIIKGLARTHGVSEESVLVNAKENVILTRLSASGDIFAQLLDKMLATYKPDLIFVDPMFPFWGSALSDLGKFTEFTRNRIAPILDSHRV